MTIADIFPVLALTALITFLWVYVCEKDPTDEYDRETILSKLDILYGKGDSNSLDFQKLADKLAEIDGVPWDGRCYYLRGCNYKNPEKEAMELGGLPSLSAYLASKGK